VKPDSCPTNKPLVVNAYATIENGLDYGADGHIWAQDTLTNFVQVRHLGGDAYCVQVHSVGTSTTFAGLSPEGTGHVRAGVTASFDGVFWERINGTFTPKFPTTGLSGNFDLQCSQDGTCAGSVPSIESAYFSSVHTTSITAHSYSPPTLVRAARGTSRAAATPATSPARRAWERR
jgi:hypothetical protein